MFVGQCVDISIPGHEYETSIAVRIQSPIPILDR